jgi:hypothetical protein
MSGGSIGTILGGIVGGIVGYFTPVGAGYGAQLGMMIGGGVGTALDPPKGPKNTGPRLNDLTVQTSTYGATIPRVYGTIALFGNVFWLENNKLKEVATTESQGGKGMPGLSGGGETTTYAYFATFALGLCEGPIIGIRRIWIGPKLFYDTGSTNKSTLNASKANKQYFTLYLGDEDQTANTRMQATLGAANVPGFRGLAYLVFYDLPLADYGNTLLAAQIKVEVVKAGTFDHIFETLLVTSAEAAPESFALYKNRYLVLSCRFPESLKIISIEDPENPLLISALSIPDAGQIVVSGGYGYKSTGAAGYLQIIDLRDPYAPVLISSTHVGNPAAGEVVGEYGFFACSFAFKIYSVDDKTSPALISSTTLATSPTAIKIIGGDYAYLITSGTLALEVWDIADYSIPVLVTSIVVGSTFAFAEYGNYLFLGQSGGFQVLDISDPASPALIYTENGYSFGRGIAINGDYLFVEFDDILDPHIEAFYIDDPANPVLIGASDSLAWDGKGLIAHGNYIHHIAYNGTDSLTTLYFYNPVISPSSVPLSDIVSAEALQSNLLEAADIDVTTLTPTVRGYRVSEVAAIRAGIEPLRAAWPFDVVQHGYQIKFVLRGTSSVATITEGELDAREAGGDPGVQITNHREMDSILPRKVSVKHFDVNREYDPGEQYAERINTDAVNVLDLDLPIVLTAQEAAQKAEVLLYLYWMERYDIAVRLPPDYSELEPGDVITITADDATYELRLTSIVYTADGRLECKAKYNSVALYVPVATGEEGQSTGVTLEERGATVFVLLDIPMLQDVYDMPGFPVAMTGYLSGWPGGILFRSDDNGQSWIAAQGFTRPGSTMGYATDTLVEHGGTVLDKSGLLTVRLWQGTLASVTEAQLFAGSNWFAYGADDRWEIIAAQNCVLQGDGTYILSDFLRGQMGTEWATGLHAVGDKIIHLSSSGMAFMPVASSSIGVEKQYRGVTAGDALDTADDLAFTYAGVNLECLSPCHLTGNRHPSTNDWMLTWTRRTRFAGWRSFVDAELGEASESYEVDIFSDNTYTTLKRTLTATSETVAYTSAQQVTDFGSNQSTLYMKIYQLSATVGRGYPLTTSITRS